MADGDAGERNDSMKATNSTATPPVEDVARGDRGDYPALPADRREIHAGSGGRHAPPAYGAPPGRNIDRHADPAAPDTHPADVSRRPGEAPRTIDESVGLPGSARGPGEQAPPATVADRAGGGQQLRANDGEIDRGSNPARLDTGAAAEATANGASTGHGRDRAGEPDQPPPT